MRAYCGTWLAPKLIALSPENVLIFTERSAHRHRLPDEQSLFGHNEKPADRHHRSTPTLAASGACSSRRPATTP
ncbi:MAG: hypothetical protein MZV64_18930 [Ignavibacteriales bacterium]|nr:hypothetical protein [Ignavibacteriales bacterium]